MCVHIKLLKILSVVIAVGSFICGTVILISEYLFDFYRDTVEFIIIMFTCINQINAIALIFGIIRVSTDILFVNSKSNYKINTGKIYIDDPLVDWFAHNCGDIVDLIHIFLRTSDCHIIING